MTFCRSLPVGLKSSWPSTTRVAPYSSKIGWSSVNNYLLACLQLHQSHCACARHRGTKCHNSLFRATTKERKMNTKSEKKDGASQVWKGRKERPKILSPVQTNKLSAWPVCDILIFKPHHAHGIITLRDFFWWQQCYNLWMALLQRTEKIEWERLL